MNFWERDNSDYGKKDNNDSNKESNNRGGYGNSNNQNSRGYGSNAQGGADGGYGSGMNQNYNGNGYKSDKKSGDNINNQDFERFATDSFNKYAGMDEAQLMSELLKTAGNMRSNGTLKSEDLEIFYKNAAAFLTTEQLAKMRMLINMLKSGD